MTENMMQFQILGIEHIAVAVDNSDKSADFFGSILNLNHIGNEEVVSQKVMTNIFDTGAGKVELLSATDPVSPVSKFIEKRGTGLHHIAFLVNDIHAAIQYLKLKDIQLIDKEPRKGAEGNLVVFIHPHSCNGLLIELCQKISD